MTISRALVVRLVVLLLLGATAAVLGIRAATRVAKYRAVDRVCDAADRGAWETALRESTPLVGTDPEGLRAAECRCTALLETGEQQACVDLLEGLLESPEVEEWLPEPMMTGLLVVSREERGDVLDAADLAHRGAARYPASSVLQVQELLLRSRTEDESSVLAEMRRRLEEAEAAGRAVPVLTLRLAQRYEARAEWDQALELLGDGPDRFPEDLRDVWFEVHAKAMAGLGRMDELAATFEEWRRRGGDPVELRARHALLLSLNQLNDPDYPILRRLADVVAEGDRLEDRDLLLGAYIRLIGSLVVAGRHEQALGYFEEASAQGLELGFITREDILRSETLATLGEEGLEALHGELLFRVPDPRPGDTVLVSPDAGRPVDSPYVELPVPASGRAAGRVRVDRRIGTWPQRWVLRDGRGRTVASGAAWPTPGHTVEVRVERRGRSGSGAGSGDGGAASPEPISGSIREPGTRRPADGTRRVFQVILDCADWRLVQYGRARGELPFFDRMVREGRRTVLESIPPFTAAAITKLVYPEKQGLRSALDLLHQLGGEIQGLNFVGVNPFQPLEWVLPEESQLFETFARGGLGTVNLLRSHGTLQVGRQAQVLGPGDRVRQLPGYEGSRRLTGDELRLLGAADEVPTGLLEEMAADFDVLERLAEGETVEFVSLRVASLDIMTHSRFQTMNRTGQDDGEALLYRTYRYMDRRLGALAGALDEDDVLIVMSDHGIRTPMEHDRRALFVVAGRDVEPGRIPGTPPIREVSGWIADMLGVETDWPGAGDVDWIATPQSGRPGDERDDG
ncbi:MAG: hypothetical protein PVG07_01250 [Acidobacteriota bacterium]|jgi:tetratricopeptide (TPR) repeat protein